MKHTIDPRLAVIERRLAGARRIVAITGGKGGIGKSSTASVLALAMAEAGHRVGLFDLDLTGPTDHAILGAPMRFPREEHGIEPTVVDGVRFLSVAQFAGSAPAPLRGDEMTHVLLELLAIARWQDLDLLVVDMPPGLSDLSLDVLRFMPRAESLVVMTPSQVVVETVRKHLRFLKNQGAPIAGLIENMAFEHSRLGRALAHEMSVAHLGVLPRDEALEEATGSPARLRDTRFGRALAKMGAALMRGS